MMKEICAQCLQPHVDPQTGKTSYVFSCFNQDQLLDQVDFRALNLLDITSLGRQFDFIFCRNVMIYFDKAIQQRVVTTLERHLKPGGYLFIAHSESLNGIAHGLEPLLPAVFRRRT